MKYLCDYSEQRITDTMNKYGAFFAFSNEQFDKGKKPGIDYVSLGAGLICPQEHQKEFVAEMLKGHDLSVAEDLAENGKEAIIKRELYNHESFYTGCIESAFDALYSYPVTKEEVYTIYREELQNVDFEC